MLPPLKKISVRRRFAVRLAAALWLVGFFLHAAPLATNAPAPAWPAPPAEPYIVFQRTIAGPQDIGAKASSWMRLANWVTGVKANAENLSRPFGLSLNADGSLLVTDAGLDDALADELRAAGPEVIRA